MRHAPRIDATHRAIVAALKGAGCSVQALTPAGGHDAGLPDLLVGRNRRVYLLEIKTRTTDLSPGQLAWHAWWRGPAVAVVRSAAEALAAVGSA